MDIDGLTGWRRLALGDVGSTNTSAMESADAGDRGQLWVTARRQLQGKARRGRGWVSEEGN
ncbi:MAG: biotin--[acetyl-CoA-carboxylase] ligase, partial [Pseudomonadota bacterium]